MTPRKLRYAVAASVVVHGFVATLVIVRRVDRLVPARELPPAEVFVDIQPLQTPATPMVEPASQAPTVVRPRAGDSRAAADEGGDEEVRAVAPPSVAEPGTPAPQPAASGHDRFGSFWRPPLSTPLPAAPSPPQISRRRSHRLDLPLQPAPNVMHHRPLPRGVEGPHDRPSGVHALVRPDGTIAFRDPTIVSNVRRLGLGLKGNHDLEGRVAGLLGVDPNASEKKQIAEATREVRLALARSEYQRVMRTALFHLKQRFEGLLRAPGYRPAERRAVAFEMWDECLEGGDDERARLLEAARATTIAFIRRAFPAGTPDAYDKAELASLNRRRQSSRRFDPYAAN
jgi:hypothetical protein